jgi:hypothetical protein
LCQDSCTIAHAARLARPLAPRITRVCCFQASPVLTKKKKSRAAGLSWRRAGCAAVSVPFLPKSGATVADVQNSITRLQHLFIPITQCLPPVRPRGWATSLKTLLAASMWHAAQTGRSAKFANAVCVPLIAPPFACFLVSGCNLPYLLAASPLLTFAAFNHLTLHRTPHLHLLFIDCFVLLRLASPGKAALLPRNARWVSLTKFEGFVCQTFCGAPALARTKQCRHHIASHHLFRLLSICGCCPLHRSFIHLSVSGFSEELSFLERRI